MGKTKTRLGIERTFNGWIRTAVLLVGIGAIFTEDVFEVASGSYLWWFIGVMFIVTGTIILMYSFQEFYLNLRKLNFDDDEETQGMPVWLMGLVSLLMIITALGILMLAFI